MTVLITGAAGFIGRHLTEFLAAQELAVRATDLHTERLSHVSVRDNVEVVSADITDAAAMSAALENVDVVYHLAAAHLDVNLPEEHYTRVNVDASRVLVRLAAEAGVKRFLHCSSVGVYGDTGTDPASELTPCHPRNIYGRSKLAGEQAAFEEAERVGLELVVVRPAWVYGPGCERTAKLLRTIARGKFLLVGGGRNYRHPIFIDDFLRGIELAAGRGAPGQVYILAGERPLTVAELAAAAAGAARVSAPQRAVPFWFTVAVVSLVELAFKCLKRPPPVSRRSLEFFQTNNAFSIDKAVSELGFHPEVDLATGLRSTQERLTETITHTHTV